MPTGGKNGIFNSAQHVSIIRRCGGTCRRSGVPAGTVVAGPVSIIRRCGGTCRRACRTGCTCRPCRFQSSEDVGGHADHRGTGHSRPPHLYVSIIRRCGGTCRRTLNREGFTRKAEVSIIRRCGGTCRPWQLQELGLFFLNSFNHPKMWGDMPT